MTDKLRIGRTADRMRSMELIDWYFLAVAVKELALARLWHAIAPTGRIVERLRLRRPAGAGDTEAVGAPQHGRDLERCAWAIACAARVVPWRSDCLLQAMAAHRWLRRWGETPDFHLGVKLGERGLDAHAWLRCRGHTVTGGASEDYAELLRS